MHKLIEEMIESVHLAQEAYPMPPLHLAIEHWEPDEVRRLIAEGADPNLPEDYSGTRPIQLAVDIECESALRREEAGEEATPHATLTAILLAAGADPDLPDKRGETARIWARDRNHREAIALFDAWKPGG